MNAKIHKPQVVYGSGNRRGFHIFIISACSRNVKYILTENVPADFVFSPGLFVIRACAARLHPKGTSSRFALRAPRRFAPRNDNLGDCFRFNAALFGSAVQRRARLSLPLQRSVDALCRFPIFAPSPSKSFRPCPLILHIVPPIRHPAAGHRNSCKSAKKRENFTQIFVDKNRIW